MWVRFALLLGIFPDDGTLTGVPSGMAREKCWCVPVFSPILREQVCFLLGIVCIHFARGTCGIFGGLLSFILSLLWRQLLLQTFGLTSLCVDFR